MPIRSFRRAVVTASAAAMLVGAVLAAAPAAPAAPPLLTADAAHAEAPAVAPTMQALAAVAATSPTAKTGTPAGVPSLRSLSRHVTPACVGTGTDGNRVQVLYARDSTTKSRFAAVTPTLRSLTANVDDTFAVSAAKWGKGQRVRWVTGANCQPTITEVVLPKGTLASGNWTTFRNAMIAKGYKAPNRKYLVFGDAKAICGLGDHYYDSSADPAKNWNNGKAVQFARIDSGCWLPGTSKSGNAVPHELMHTLGGVSADAPHKSAAGHCTDTTDAMCYSDGPGVVMRKACTGELLFDCGGDDYYNPAAKAGTYLATHWNTARSSFLTPAVALPAAPAGAVTGPASAKTGALITLTASVPRGAVSYRWTGPGLTGATTKARATARVLITSKATYTLSAGYTNGRSVVATKTVTVTKAPAPKISVSVPAKVRSGKPFTITVRATVTGAVRGVAWGAPKMCKVASSKALTSKVTCTLPKSWTSGWASLGVAVQQSDGQAVQAASRTIAITR